MTEVKNAMHHNALKKRCWALVARGEGGQEHVRATLSFVNKIAFSGVKRFFILMMYAQYIIDILKQ